MRQRLVNFSLRHPVSVLLLLIGIATALYFYNFYLKKNYNLSYQEFEYFEDYTKALGNKENKLMLATRDSAIFNSKNKPRLQYLTEEIAKIDGVISVRYLTGAVRKNQDGKAQVILNTKDKSEAILIMVTLNNYIHKGNFLSDVGMIKDIFEAKTGIVLYSKELIKAPLLNEAIAQFLINLALLLCLLILCLFIIAFFNKESVLKMVGGSNL